MAYVEIVRHFRDLGSDPLPPASRRMLRGLRDPTTWSDLLDGSDTRHLVLVASSGLGKSEELQAQVGRLRAGGRHAVLCSARDLVSDPGLEQALEAAEFTALGEWRASNERAVIFVDGIDELVLVRRDFPSLLRRLANMLGQRVSESQLILTARGGWLPRHAKALCERLLRANDTEQLREITFEPLDNEAIRKLADAAGCDRVDDFMRAFHADEIDATVDLRPMDVAPIVERWNTRGEIGGWSQILQSYVDTALIETDADRDFHRELHLEDARVAGQRVGAATVMMQTPFVSLPQEAASGGTIAARLLFADWTWQPLTELVATPLFVLKDAATVQLPEGPLPPYLAARWFAERWRRGQPVKWLRDQLLVRVYGEERFVIPASRRATVGWLASFVPEFRTLLKEFPEIVLYEGDPESLRDTEITQWLELLVKRIKSAQIYPWPTRGTVRRLARPGLVEAKVAELLASEGDPLVQRSLLNWAASGRYSSALPLALELALDTTLDVDVRSAAVRVVAASDDHSSRAKLLALVDADDEHLRTDLLTALVPHTLSGQELVDFVVAGTGPSFAYTLGVVAKQVSVPDLDAILDRLLPAVVGSLVDEETNRHSELAGPVLAARLRQPGPYPTAVVEMLMGLEAKVGDPGRYLGSRDVRELEELLSRDPELRRTLWRARLEKKASNTTPDATLAIHYARLGHRNSADLPWLFALAAEKQEFASDVELVIHQVLGSLSDEDREQLRTSSSLEDGLRQIIEEDITSRRNLTALQKARAEKEARQAEETRRTNSEQLEALRPAIRRGENVGALTWAWQHLTGSGVRDGLRSDRLSRVINPDLIPDFAQGYRSLWRKQEVDLPDPDERSIPLTVLAGLAGLSMEAADGLDFATLTPAEAERAAKYALYELNGFPEWFSDLLTTHEAIIRAVLTSAIDREWRSSGESLSLLRYAPYARDNEAAILREIALRLLEQEEPAGAQTLHSAIDAVLTSPGGIEPILDVTHSAVATHEDTADPRLAEWLRAWAHLAPAEAVGWFWKRLAKYKESSAALLVEVAALLEKDFDHVGSPVTASRLMSPAALEAWVALLFGQFRPEDDEEKNGFLGSRHHAQDFRHRCLKVLANNPTPAARDALARLTQHPSFAGRDEYSATLLAKQHAVAAATAATQWTEDDILRVERGDERPPRSLEDLVALVRRHLDDVARVLESDEFSYRDLFPFDTDEHRIQLWAASTLRQRSRGLYEVVRENVVDDDKEIDISAVAAGAGQVPIEIKPVILGYSARDLESTIEKQLIGQYMTQRDRTTGILVLVLHGPKPQGWTIGGKRGRTFADLVEHLRERGHTIGARYGKSIAIATIDIEANRPAQKAAKKKAAKKMATKKKAAKK